MPGVRRCHLGCITPDVRALGWQWQPPTLMRSCAVVKGLEEDHPLPQALAVFTEAGRLTGRGGQGLTHGQVPAAHGRADREPQGRQAFGPTHDARAERQQLARLLLSAPLPVDQIWMRRTERRAWASPLAGARNPSSRRGPAALRAAREHVKPSLKHTGIPATRALGAATPSLAVSSVRDPTMAAIITRNSGATLLQTHCRPSSPSGRLAPDASVSHACVRAMQFHLSSSCTGGTGRARSRGRLIASAWCAARLRQANTVASVTPSTTQIPRAQHGPGAS